MLNHRERQLSALVMALEQQVSVVVAVEFAVQAFRAAERVVLPEEGEPALVQSARAIFYDIQ